MKFERSGISTTVFAVSLIVVIIVAVGATYVFVTSAGTTPSSTSTTHPVSTTSAPSQIPVKIALLLPGQKNDLSWNEAGYDSFVSLIQGLTTSGKYSVQFTVEEGLYTPSSIQPAMQTLASEGYNLIIGDGFQFTQPSIALATQFNNTAFVNVGGYLSAHNVQTAVNRGGQQGFLMGVLSALMSKSGKVAIIGGEDVSEITWITKGFQVGVNYTNQNFGKNVQAIVTFVGNFNDPAAAKAAGASAVSQGADVLYVSGDGITEGVAAEAVAANVGYLFSEANATALAPNNTYGGVLLTVAPLFLQAFNDWMSNHALSPTPYYATLANHGLTLYVSGKVPKNVTSVMNTLLNNCISYKIQVYHELSNGSLVYQPVLPSYSSLSPSG